MQLKKQKDAPVWFHKGDREGYLHVDLSEPHSVGIFLTFSHLRLTSDS